MALLEERKSAIHLLRAGQDPKAIAVELKKSVRWVRKWRRRFQTEGWDGLKDRSRRPHKIARKTTDALQKEIQKARSELESEAEAGKGLKYIGGQAIRTRLKEKGIHPLPSISTIERIIRKAGMTRPYRHPDAPEIKYPHLKVKDSQCLIQIDIVPHYLKGGARVACFNAIDVASRYPTGKAYAQKRSKEAEDFLIRTWEELGIPKYTQVDNEGCFSGGFTHPYVLGKVLRLALQAGTELVFSPVRHPQSNGFVERFHQDYNKHVWEDTYLGSIEDVQVQAQHFFMLYRQRPHRRLAEQTPKVVHQSPTRLPHNLTASRERRPLYAGQVHFIRKVLDDNTISVLNVKWAVPNGKPEQGVWATLSITTGGARLFVFDAAPDASPRRQLAVYYFKISETIFPHPLSTPKPPTSLLSSTLRFVSRVFSAAFGGTMS